MAKTAMNVRQKKTLNTFPAGFTLIELVIVVAVLAILMTAAIPSYRQYVLRVQRSGAINMLLQAAMCQERIYARTGSYDTGSCLNVSQQKQYRLHYRPANARGQNYVAVAEPLGAQKKDRCGSLSVDQSGNRHADAADISIQQCWNGR